MLAAASLTRGADVEVYFSPRGGATEAIIREIAKGRQVILIQAYEFTSVPITNALIMAEKRGVKVEAVLDRIDLRHQHLCVLSLEKSGIPVYIDGSVKIAHSKIIIIDHSEVITGSFNFTKAAEDSNAENLLVIKNDPVLVQKFVNNYLWRRSISRSLNVRGP
jgi:phosphatidylserine/phosphatidylglycerophosphate/cardiolipin synthase-like enzyme